MKAHVSLRHLLILLLCAALALGCTACSKDTAAEPVADAAPTADVDLAHRIWYAMAEAGHCDLTDAWELYGMYTFGETTGSGYVTLSTDDAGTRLRGGSWRNYPQSDSDVSDQFFPMLQVLLDYYATDEERPALNELLASREQLIILARQNALDYTPDILHYQYFDLRLQYDADYNELYVLLTVTAENDRLALKE